MTIELDDTEEPVDSLIAGVARMPEHDGARQPPEELDEYKLVRPLGRGGMGSVWLAHDRLLDRLVAIKFIAGGTSDAGMRARFEIEARAAARLQHLNVVTVHRYGTLDGQPYLVSEYIRGEALDALAKPVAWERALELGLPLARGLAAAHRAGIVHRDIKPGNAIVTGDGDVKLVDFGLARLGAVDPALTGPGAASSTSTLTAPGAIAGTPRYLAPEVRLGEQATPRSDVYGVGCILYELVTGRAPILDQRDGKVPSIAERTTARFAAIVERCLADDPAQRFASGEELREALERLATPAFGGELPEGNPYRGLVAFDAEHRGLFFGRGAEIRAVIERLRAEAFVLVTGDSGVGKSSLCRAGVIPHVLDGAFGDGLAWSRVELVPGAQPLAALASAIAPVIGGDEAALVKLLANEPGALARELRRALGPTRGVVVFIDQLEEIATLAARSDADAFAAVLGQLATRTPGVRVLATVRSDFLTRLAELPGLGDIARALYVLRPLTAEGAREAIVGPARAKGGRFESEALVDALVASVADPDRIELPLLAFTLAQLWDARDPASQVISQHSLEAIGGVRGALARHADGVLDAMLPAQRTAARRLLLRLVTADRTRARRSERELAAIDRGALDALVRARLVIARGGDESTYELAHERLIDGWPTLIGWLTQSVEAHAAHERLAAAAREWDRLARPNDTLWSERQLAAIALLADDELSATEAAFVAAARRAIRRRRVRRNAIAVGIPLALITAYAGAKLVARRDLAHHVDASVATAEPLLTRARAAATRERAQEKAAFARYDAGDLATAEPAWAEARRSADEANTAYAQAARALEAAYLLDTDRSDVRARLAEVTTERIALAPAGERAELEQRLALYDPAAAQTRNGRIHVVADPPDAAIALAGEHGDLAFHGELAPGSYTVIAHAAGRASVRLPVVVAAGEDRTVRIALPDAHAVPDGMIAVPGGSFLFGSREDEPIRKFFGAVPMHTREVRSFLIGRTEVTYRQWIAFLDDLPPAERERRRPRQVNPNTVADGGAVELRREDAGWELHITPGAEPYQARAGQPITYGDRTVRASQDWLDFPVAGVSPKDAEAYAAWLDRTGRVPHARLCSEPEWEYAARGVDGRSYPGGDKLAADDADIDVTYGQMTKAFGPDAVGSHPRSTSPFGLVDTSGNVWEITKAGPAYITRGGSYYINAESAHLANRQTIPADYRHVQIGLRICADGP